MKEQVTVLTSFPQEHVLVLAVIDRLLENGVCFRGFLENRIPDRFSPEYLDSEVILLDRGIIEKMNREEKKMLAEYSLKHVVVCYDYCNHENRTLCNFDAEITVNGALSKANIGPGEIPEQSPEIMCRFARERAETYFNSDSLTFNEFTVHHLRALSMNPELVLQVLPKLFDSQDPEFIPLNHDMLGAWCYAPLCSRLTGDENYNKKFLHILNRTMKARPYSKEGIMSGTGNVSDPLSFQGPRPLWSPHCTAGSEKVIYNEMFHFHGPVFAAAALASGNKNYLEHAMKLMRYLRDFNTDPADGIPCHYSHSGQRHGAKWSRGIAHILHGIALMFEVWPDLPESEARELTAFADSIGDGLLRTQSPSGLWHNLVDEVKSPLESSGSMAFISSYQSLIKGGRLPEEKYGEMIQKARSSLLRRCYRGGFAGNCFGTGLALNTDYYFRRPFNFLFTGQIVPALESGN